MEVGKLDSEQLKKILSIGETVAVEFKHCGNRIESDVYETVCSFLNRFGGDLFLGIEDNGTVSGVNEKIAPDLVKNFINCVSNDNLLSPTVYLNPEIMIYEGRTIIHVKVHPSTEVHSYKRIIYDRVNDADVKVRSTNGIAAMYIRKQNMYTERNIFPHVQMSDLRLDLLPRVRKIAVNWANGKHPWNDMDDMELLKSAGLYGTDVSTGQQGFNLACILLLGTDELIMNVCPAYETDAILRKVNVDRYDDREIVRTNLIESYDILMEFARKHLPDKFFVEGYERKDIRSIIAREMISNTLMHREYTSPFRAKFIILKDKMYTENANRATKDGPITLDNFEPFPKNPVIASFFRTIGRADTLGSGTRNLFKYTRFYSNANPQLIDGDVFKIIVPLDETFSYDAASFDVKPEIKKTNCPAEKIDTEQNRKQPQHISDNSEDKNGDIGEQKGSGNTKVLSLVEKLAQDERIIVSLLVKNNSITQTQLIRETGFSLSKVKRIMKKLQQDGVIVRTGFGSKASWEVKIKNYF